MHKKRAELRTNSQSVPPFLKWAGGKRWLADNYGDLFNVRFHRYVEPFLGSGAVFFKLAPSNAILADKNFQLVETYQAIRDDWKEVWVHLNKHHRHHSSDYYYSIRQRSLTSVAERAAKFIYLNRTCWNGLYRVNLKGEFNVPLGTKTNVVLQSDDFEAVSKLLSSTQIMHADFESTLSFAAKDDLVFVDPPYTVKHNKNGFIKYNEALFTWDDQIRLRDAVLAAARRGAKVIVTNASHKSLRDLYKGLGKQTILNRASIIAGNNSGRGRYEEMVIQCF